MADVSVQRTRNTMDFTALNERGLPGKTKRVIVSLALPKLPRWDSYSRFVRGFYDMGRSLRTGGTNVVTTFDAGNS